MKKQRKPLSRYMRISLYVFATATAILLMNRLLSGSHDLLAFISTQLGRLSTALAPFISAMIVAYLLNPLIGLLQKLLRKVFPKMGERTSNLIAVLAVYAGIIILLVVMVVLYIPGFASNISDLISNTNNYYGQVREFVEETVLAHPFAVQIGLQTMLENYANTLISGLRENWAGLLTQALQRTIHLLSGLINFLLVFLIAIYISIERLRLKRTALSSIHAFFSKKAARKTIEFFKDADIVFGRYLSAKMISSLVLAMFCTIGFAAFGVRYSILLGSIIGVMNMIPYVGGFISTTLTILITLLDNPAKIGAAILVPLISQTIENYIVSPIISADRVGINAFWSLAAVILGGSLFGVPGTFLGVPVMRVIQILYARFIQMRRIQRARSKTAAVDAGEGKPIEPEETTQLDFQPPDAE